MLFKDYKFISIRQFQCVLSSMYIYTPLLSNLQASKYLWKSKKIKKSPTVPWSYFRLMRWQASEQYQPRNVVVCCGSRKRGIIASVRLGPVCLTGPVWGARCRVPCFALWIAGSKLLFSGQILIAHTEWVKEWALSPATSWLWRTTRAFHGSHRRYRFPGREALRGNILHKMLMLDTSLSQRFPCHWVIHHLLSFKL